MTAEIWKAGLLAVGEACKAIFWFTVEETHHSMFKKRLMKGRGWMNHESWSLKDRRIPSNRGGIQSCIPGPNEGTFDSSGSSVDETIISAFSALHQAKGAETIGVNGKRFCLLWCKWKEMIDVNRKRFCLLFWTVYSSTFFLLIAPQWGAADTEIKVPSGENTELKRSPFKAWSRSIYSHACYAYFLGFLPCLFLPFQSIHLHFSKTSPNFFSCVGLQNK